MVCILFSKHLEARFFYNTVVREYKCWLLKEQSYGFEVILQGDEPSDDTYRDIIHAFVELIRARKWLGWIEGILKYRYYYTDQQEINRILEIGREFEDECPGGLALPPVLDQLRSTVENEVDERDNLTFDEVVVTCLQSLHEPLIEYTGYLIDEYKQEESYQLLLDSWRHRVQGKDTGVRRLHLLDLGELHYYHDEGNPISPSETELYLKQYPDDSVDDLPRSWSVTAALVHAPDELVIYSDKKADSTLELLMNIFEEKAAWRALAEFPFEMS